MPPELTLMGRESDRSKDTWLAGETGMVGYPTVNVRDIETDKLRATQELMGID